MQKENNYLFGYFEGQSDTPAYDPGTSVPCMYCQNTLSAPIKTISLMVPGQNRSYFYRMHKGCYEGMAPEEVSNYEGALIDNIT